jgi:hypothetical protein
LIALGRDVLQAIILGIASMVGGLEGKGIACFGFVLDTAGLLFGILFSIFLIFIGH